MTICDDFHKLTIFLTLLYSNDLYKAKNYLFKAKNDCLFDAVV